MSGIDSSSRRVPAAPGPRHASYLDSHEPDRGTEIAAWVSRHKVTVTVVAMIIVQLIWIALFLRGFDFRQDDIHFTEIALNSPLDWKYLSYVGSGHLHPGVLLVVWILARVALYSWGAASLVTLVMVAIASLAAWWLLRTLLGNRPAILIPLALYLFSPLNFPNDSWWQSGIESLPLQAAIFASLAFHLRYIRSGGARNLAAATVCLAIGLFFFEKAAVIPVLLFAVTAGFLPSANRLAASIRVTLIRYWRAWVVYAVVVAAYGAVLLDALRSSTVKPGSSSLASSLSFSGDLVTHSLLPGLLGGPWTWTMFSNAAVAYASPPAALVWLAGVALLAIIVISVLTRPWAGRAWASLAIWVLLADIAPVLLGRVSSLGAGISGLIGWDTRYVADAPAIAAICVALAFWPVARSAGTRSHPASARTPEFFGGPRWRAAGIGLTGVLVVGSIVSVHNYQSTTRVSNALGKAYLANARASLADAPRGSVIFDQAMPQDLMMSVLYGRDSYQSAVLGPTLTGKAAHNVRWSAHPSGTIKNLLMFASDGRLHQAQVTGIHSLTRPAGRNCWPEIRGRVVVRFATSQQATFTGLLRLGYLAGNAADGEDVAVTYAGQQQQLIVQPGLNSVYFPVHGGARSVSLALPGAGICVGDAEIGHLQASPFPLSPAQASG